MAISSANISINFDLVNGTIQLIDVHDYASEGWDNVNVEGRIVITGPDGEIFYQTLQGDPADVVRSVGSSSVLINIPRLGDGSFELGLYSFQYTATDTISNDVVGIDKSFEFCYKSPEIELEMKADCLLPLLSSEDKTDYVVGGITPTITRTHKLHYPVGSDTETYNGGNVKYLPTQIFYTKTHSAELTSDLNYEYPDKFFVIDRIKGAEEINVKCDNTLCDMYCCLIGMYYRFRDAQSTNRTLAKELETKWIRAEALRNRVYDAYKCNKAEDVSGLVEEILKLGDCQPGCGCADGDKPTLITSITSDPFTPLVNDLVQQIGGGSGGSGEVNGGENLGAGRAVFAGKPAEDLQFKTFIAGGGIQLSETATEITISATPSSGGGTSGTTVVLAGSGISVTDLGSGTTTSYSVSVEQSLIDKINALYNTTVVAGDGVSVTETIDGNGNREYEISSTSSAPDYVEVLYKIDLSGTIIPIFQTIHSKSSGGDFVAPDLKFVTEDGTQITDANLFGRNPIRINVSGFKTGGADYIPHVELLGFYGIEFVEQEGPFGPVSLPLSKPIDDFFAIPSIAYTNTGSANQTIGNFNIRLIDNTGSLINPSNIRRLNRNASFYFSIKIT
jgi:hypothetical protein